MNRSIKRGLLLGALIATLTMSNVLAHGDISRSNPAADATVEKVPKVVSVDFTETPTKGASEITVRDGCDRDVISDSTLSGHTIEAAIGTARPGKWEVRYRIVSAEDGHPSNGSFSFRVRGKPRCEREPRAERTPDDVGTAGTPLPSGDEGDSGGSIPWIPIVLGTGALLGVALLVRRGGG